MSSGLAALCFLLLHTGALGFGILTGQSLNHQEITKSALLNVTVEVCRALAQAEGTVFTAPPQPYTTEAVATACGAAQSSKSYRLAIIFITLMNVRVDLRHALNGSFHFDEEMFAEGKNIITEGITAVKASNKLENYEAARQKIGEIFHPLQDFYSHSNWVELGNTLPNANLIRTDASIGNVADINRATCRNCNGDDCTNNILDDIIQEKVLTSGYFGIVPIVSTKPKGKCSHGGAVDQTSTIEPTGGINKDSFTANHGHLHTAAANMAIAATSELLEDIRRAAGDRPFLQMLGIFKGSSKALCIVIDTTKSMSDDIAAVKAVTSTIINSEVGTENEPAVYILVPFNDPDFGPLLKTTDPNVFKKVIDNLSAAGGGDDQEMSLSGLQLALSAAPSNSEIFLFTDAPAKDKQLKSAVIALIERTQSVVIFMISGTTVVNRRKRSTTENRISESDAQLFTEVAWTSGGLVIEVEKSELAVATSIITQFSNTSLVTLLQAARSPGNNETFPFMVDDTVTNPTVFITGRSINFTLISPTGESQQSSDTSGSLITSSQSVGNFITLQLTKIAGLWEIKMASTNPYTVKVIGQSPIDFLFDFVEASQGLFSGFDALDTRPRAGVNGSLLVSLTGSDTATVTEVDLVESSGSAEIKGVLEDQGSGNFLVNVDRIPSVPFVVRVKGRDDSASSRASVNFQRQSSISLRASNVTITADSNSILVPGTQFSVPFSVSTSGVGGNFTIRATNSRGYDSTFPTSLFLETGNSTNGTVTMLAPLNTPSGTDVTLIIEAEAPGGEDTNYVMLLFSIVNTVTDFTQPVCQLLSLESNCSDICSLEMWKLSARVTDGDDGTGVDRVSLRKGNGTLNTTLDAGNENITLVSYSSSCCSPDMELLAVDRVGNVGVCSYNFQDTVSASTKVILSPLLCLSLVVLGLHVQTELGIL